MPYKNHFYSYSFFLCLLCLLSLASANTARCSYNGDDYFVIANDLLNKGMYLEALGIYEEITKYSDNTNNRARALLLMGTTYSLYLDLYDKALQQFEHVIKRYPDSPSAPEALFNAGIVFHEKGEYKRAYEVFIYYTTTYPNGIRRQSAEVWADSSKDQMAEAKPVKPPPREHHIKDTIVRVLIKNSVKRVVVNSKKMITVIEPVTQRAVYKGPGPLTFTGQGKYFKVNGRRLGHNMCGVTSDDATIMVDNRRYRGAITIIANSRSLDVVKHIPTEQYLYGVVPQEMSHEWGKEALMAQAIAARTYALYVKEKSTNKPYDVEATTASQVYGGYDAETRASNSAVDATRGQVMMHNGDLIIAYFHANSGGFTEDAQNVWGADLPYLRGIPDRFSENIPGGTWEYFLSFDEARKRLNKYGLNIGWISELKQGGVSRSGRTLKMKVVSDKGTFLLKSNNFRIKVGGTKLRSTLFQIKPYKHGILIRGNGYGHGVGMSQWGARKMAQSGFGCQEILKHYYRGVRIVALDSPRG